MLRSTAYLANARSSINDFKSKSIDFCGIDILLSLPALFIVDKSN
jgi:hypothetical protein